MDSPTEGMGMLEITEAATDVLERAYRAATRFNPQARVRIYRAGGRIETGFADLPQPGETTIEHAGLILFVEEDITGTLDVSAQHDRLMVSEG
ncbi:MAG: hypothetical protein ACRDJF_06330 [Actinomycetota bacterium]